MSATKPLRVVVLASGRGSNLGALIDVAQMRRASIDHAPVEQASIEIVLVAGDKAHAPALRLAEDAGIATLALDPKSHTNRAAFDAELFARIEAYMPDLLVLAGFMRILDAGVIAPWVGRMINIHPSLLPKYRGLNTHAQALAARDVNHGASVHFVTPELDGGPLLAQAEIPLVSGDTAATLASRLLPLEHRLLVACVRLFAERRVALRGDRVEYDGALLAAPLKLGADGALVTAT